jgi:hypothetical protein
MDKELALLNTLNNFFLTSDYILCYCRGANLSQKKRPYKNVSRILRKQNRITNKRIYRYKAITKERN